MYDVISFVNQLNIPTTRLKITNKKSLIFYD